MRVGAAGGGGGGGGDTLMWEVEPIGVQKWEVANSKYMCSPHKNIISMVIYFNKLISLSRGIAHDIRIYNYGNPQVHSDAKVSS